MMFTRLLVLEFSHGTLLKAVAAIMKSPLRKQRLMNGFILGTAWVISCGGLFLAVYRFQSYSSAPGAFEFTLRNCALLAFLILIGSIATSWPVEPSHGTALGALIGAVIAVAMTAFLYKSNGVANYWITQSVAAMAGALLGALVYGAQRVLLSIQPPYAMFVALVLMILLGLFCGTFAGGLIVE